MSYGAHIQTVSRRFPQPPPQRKLGLMRRLYETSGGSAGVTRFVYDGDELIGEYDGSGAQLQRYVHGAGADDPLVWYAGAAVSASARQHLFTDHQGSVTATASSSGALSAVNSYDEWGIPAALNRGRFQYTGQAYIPELGMYHYKARIYAPTLGRFLQTDPIDYQDQVNLYAYVGNDPTDGRDPTGLETANPLDPCGGKNGAKPSATCVGSTKPQGDGAGAKSRKSAQNGNRSCPSGARVAAGGGVSATGFLGIFGLSGGISGGVSVPAASLRNFSLRGIQFSIAGSVTPLVGVGLFAGAGPSYSLGGVNSPSQNFSGSVTPVLQLGVGDGGGVEVTGDFTSPLNEGVAIGRIAAGIYGAVGARFTGTAATDPIGCK